MSKAEEKARELAAAYPGNHWQISKRAGELFLCGETPIRFFADPTALKKRIANEFYDYVESWGICEETNPMTHKWTSSEVIPVASLALPEHVDAVKTPDRKFIEQSIGFLLYDSRDGSFLYAATDDWSEDHRIKKLDKLGLHEAR